MDAGAANMRAQDLSDRELDTSLKILTQEAQRRAKSRLDPTADMLKKRDTEASVGGMIAGPDRPETARVISPESIAFLFTYHPPDPYQQMQYESIREGARFLAGILIRNTPQGADQTAAIRKLRECVMTANAAIALRGFSL
jgi:hypothetical protein